MTWNIGSVSGKGEVCEELSKRMIDMYYLQEVRWRERGSMMLVMEGRRYTVSIILLLSSSQTSPFPLTLPIFHVTTYISFPPSPAS